MKAGPTHPVADPLHRQSWRSWLFGALMMIVGLTGLYLVWGD